MLLVKPGRRSHDFAIEAPIDHQDVTTIMRLLGDMQHDIARILKLLEDELGEEEEVPEDDS
jgi:phage host-nuclease inhibitor protein Gam